MRNFFDVLLKDKIWAAPTGDWQYPLQPAKISPSNGYISTFNVGNTILQLPDSNSPYHVFQAGRLNPELLKLTIGNDKWASLDQITNQYNMYTMAYTDYGIVTPRCNVYYRFHNNKNMYFALRWDYNVYIDYISLQNLYIRFFMSTYTEDNPSVDVGTFNCMSSTLETSSDVDNLSSYFEQFPSENTSVWIDGYLSSISQLTTGVTADVLYDPSFKYNVSSRLSSLPTFLSTLDSQRKYLFHILPNNINELDFLNNIDFYLVGESNGNNYGLYIHRNNISNIRSITFHDYAIKAINIQNCLSNLPLLPTSYDFYIKANVRYSGFNLDLLDTKNRLLSLYNINPEFISSLLAGINSNSLWNAATLEESATNLYMQSYENELDTFTPESVGGYFSTTNELCKPIVDLIINNIASVPPCFAHGFTALEFINGLLSNINYNNENGIYQVSNPNTTSIYFINGLFSHTTNNIYYPWSGGVFNVPLNIEYRVYGQNSQNQYVDITTLVPSVVNDTGISLTYINGYSSVIVKTNQYFYMESFSIQATLSSLECDISDPFFTQIPYATVDVFLNGYYLTKDVDYIIVNNIVYISNFDYVNLTTYNFVLVLCRGFCNSEMLSLDLDDFSISPNTSSFIETFNESLSSQKRPLVVTINNKLYNNIEVPSNSFIADNINYISIKTPLINSFEYLQIDSQTLLEESLSTNQIIENIENTLNNNTITENPIVNKLKLVSIFLSTILTNLINGNYDDIVYSDYVEADVGNYFLGLSQLLSNDPLWNNRVNSVYFSILGFNINFSVSLNKQYFDFYMRVLNYYSNERFDYFDTVTNMSITM